MAHSAVIKHDVGYLSTLPLGSIIAWHRDFSETHAVPLPPGWAECNGQVLDDPESPYHDHVIPNLNGDAGAGQGGFFLRGKTRSGDIQEDQLQSHTHTDAGHQHLRNTDGRAERVLVVPEERRDGHATDNGDGNSHIVGNLTASAQARLGEPTASSAGAPRHGTETRPVNMSVVWIMKVKQVTAVRAVPAVEAHHQAPLGSVYVDREGHVGIGTPDPSARLVVGAGGTANEAVLIYAGPSSWSSIYFGDGLSGDATYRGVVQYNHADDHMDFYTANAERMRIDGNGNVGIGTAQPRTNFEIANNYTMNARVSSQDGIRLEFGDGSDPSAYMVVGAYGGINNIDNKGRHFIIANGNVAVLNGNVGIGTNSPQHLLDVEGTIRASHTATNTLWIQAGSFESSDFRNKKGVSTMADAVEKVLALRGVRFTRSDSEETDSPQIGLVAQEVEAVFPEVVEADGDGIKGVNYGRLVAPLIEVVKRQQQQIEELQATVQSLRQEKSSHKDFEEDTP